MITDARVAGYIEESLPEMKSELRKASARTTSTAYSAVQSLTDFTRLMVQNRNYSMVRRCLTLAGKLYVQGNDAVKNAVENVYVFSFSSMLTGCGDFREKNVVQAAIPGSLYRVYTRQIIRSGL